MSKIYITTALPYVNSSPHIGFAYEIVFADVIARYFRMLGNDVCFLTGTDENSFKIARVAKEKGVTPLELADKNSIQFEELKKLLNISYDIFYRTSDSSHIKGSQEIWEKIDKKDIYRDLWSSWYCVGCESFYSKDKLIDGVFCPEHFKKLEYVQEEDYFFKIDHYRHKLIEVIKNDSVLITPKTKKSEVVEEIANFKNYNISRQRESDWGVPLPDNSNEVVYTFLEALMGYINGLGYYFNKKNFEYWWQDRETRIIHIIGKGITKFHTIYWLGLLLSCGLRLPTDIIIHSYVTINGQKVSKSIGNTIDIVNLIDTNSIDSIRYFLIKTINPYNDTDFDTTKTSTEFNKDINDDLIFILEASKKRFSKDKENPEKNSFNLLISTAHKKYHYNMASFKLNKALIIIINVIKELRKELSINNGLYLPKVQIKEVLKMLYPFIPDTVLCLEEKFEL